MSSRMTKRGARLAAVAAVAALSLGPVSAQPGGQPEGQTDHGAAVFSEHCAFCHLDSANSRAPTLESLSAYSPEAVIRALTDGGAMRAQGYNLSGEQRRQVAEYVTGKEVGGIALTDSESGRCDESVDSPPLSRNMFSRASWNGWGPDISNSHFQPGSQAGLRAEDVPSLKLKWAFGFQDASAAWSQPTVVGGRLYVGSQAGKVFSLDAESGCILWSFTARSGVRTSVTITETAQTTTDGQQLYTAVFGDMTGNAYALNAATGELVWEREVESHPLARMTGSPVVYEDRIYIPMSSFEESQGSLEHYGCCTFRGSVSVLDLISGDVIWKTYLVDEPQLRGEKENGVKLYGPAGGAVWSAPTIDPERGRIYVSVGNAYAEPQPATTDAVLALDMESGDILWTKQTTPDDIYVTGCRRGGNCPQNTEVGEDLDFGTSPVLASLPDGRELIIVGQKSGMAYAMDPDAEGEIIWQYRAGEGGALGGIEWGTAVDEKNAYIPLSDLLREQPGGLHAVDLGTGERVWHAPPAPLLCGEPGRGCSAAQPAAITVIPGIVFSGAVDGGFRAYSTETGEIVWQYDTNQQFKTVNGIDARGASLIGPGPTVVDGMVFVNSGYGSMGGRDGNVLLAFGLE